MLQRTTILTLTVAFLLLAAGILAFPPWRVETLTLSERRSGTTVIAEQSLIRVNRLTGSTARLEDGKWRLVEKDERKEEPLPPEAARFVTGRAGFEAPSLFKVSIYNGSNYRLTAVIVRVKAEAKKTEDSYERGFYEKVDIPPLSEGTATILVTQPPDYVKHDWSINALYGHEVLRK